MTPLKGNLTGFIPIITLLLHSDDDCRVDEPECQKRVTRESPREAESRGLESERWNDQANIECHDMRWIS